MNDQEQLIHLMELVGRLNDAMKTAGENQLHITKKVIALETEYIALRGRLCPTMHGGNMDDDKPDRIPYTSEELVDFSDKVTDLLLPYKLSFSEINMVLMTAKDSAFEDMIIEDLKNEPE